MNVTLYSIELITLELNCIVTISISSLSKESFEKTTFPSKRKACETIKHRFSDLDFENDKLIFNGIQVSTKFELIKLMDKELMEESVATMMISELY